MVKTSFKANTKALAENEGDGIAKVLMLATSFLQSLQLCHIVRTRQHVLLSAVDLPI